MSETVPKTIREYLDRTETGYAIEQDDDRYRWLWLEPGEPVQFGGWRNTLGGALRAAADDWDENGNLGDGRARILRGAATKADNRATANALVLGKDDE